MYLTSTPCSTYDVPSHKLPNVGTSLVIRNADASVAVSEATFSEATLSESDGLSTASGLETDVTDNDTDGADDIAHDIDEFFADDADDTDENDEDTDANDTDNDNDNDDEDGDDEDDEDDEDGDDEEFETTEAFETSDDDSMDATDVTDDEFS